jgi:hypothetical protein
MSSIGTAFTTKERRAFGLTGRLPHRINSLDEQCQRAWDQLETCGNDLAKNTFLQSLRDQNWVLYYALISRHLKELIPIIYTPTEVSCYCLRRTEVRSHAMLGRSHCKLLTPVQEE